jgi:hypothetical protein
MQEYMDHPQLLVALLIHGMLPAAGLGDIHGRQSIYYRPIAATKGLLEVVLCPEGGVLDQLLAGSYQALFRQLGRSWRVRPWHGWTRLLREWPAERVLNAVVQRLSSSNNQVVLGALMALQHLQEDPNWSPEVAPAAAGEDTSAPAEASSGTTAVHAEAEAVAAAVRELAQVGEMRQVVRGLKEAAVHLAQQHQQLRAGVPSAGCSAQQRQQQQQHALEQQQAEQQQVAPAVAPALGTPGALCCSKQHSQSSWGFGQKEQQQQQQQGSERELEEPVGPPFKRRKSDAAAAAGGLRRLWGMDPAVGGCA